MVQRYVIICGQVYRWEEKAPFGKSGKSIIGAIEYNRETDALKCHECGEWVHGLYSHVPGKHMPSRDYKLRHGLLLSSSLCTEKTKKKFSARPPGSSGRFRLGQRVAALIPGSRGVISRQLSVSGVPVVVPEQGHINSGEPLDNRGDVIEKSLKRAPVAPQKKGRGFFSVPERQNQLLTCPDQTILSLQKRAAELGKTPTVADVGQGLRAAAISRFGSWNKALAASGLRLNRAPVALEGELKESLRDFFVLNKRLPKVSEMGEGRLFDRGIYRRVFGSMEKAFVEAGLGLALQSYKNRKYGPKKYVSILQGCQSSESISNAS